MHDCPIKPCGVQVDDAQLMCPTHWAMVPKMLQHELYRAWNRGAGAGTEHHQEAMRACIEVVQEKVTPVERPRLFETSGVVPPGYDTAPCRWPDGGCKALVIWCVQVDGYGQIKRHDNGKAKKIPLDMRPHQDGHWRLYGAGKAQLITRGEVTRSGERYQAHHATCTALAAQRKRRKFTAIPGGRA